METVRLSIPGNVCVHCGTEITRNLQCSGCGWVDPLTMPKEAYESQREFVENSSRSIWQRVQQEQRREERARKGVQIFMLLVSPVLIWLLIQIYKLMLS